jgi:prepilin-type N-terminal cleavage/methylation domain-containing protein
MLKKYQKISKRGFTVIEILLVVTLVSILLTIGIVAFNQEDRFINARNDARKLHVQSLEAAITQYRLQEGNYPTGLDRNYKEICDPGASSCTNFIDLKTALVPKYLQSIPKDPNDTDSTGGVGYEVAVDAITNTVSIRLKEALREDGVIIAVNDPLPPDTTNNVLNPTPVINGLVLNLDAGDTSSYSGSGTNWIDLVGNDNNGTLVNGVNYNSTNGSLVFDGSDDMVEGSIDGNIFTSNFTQTAWIYKSNADLSKPWQGIFTNSVASSFFGTNNTYLMTFGNGSPEAPLNSVGVNQVGASADGVFLDIGTHINKWLYIVITKTGSSLNIYCYKDGSLLQSSGTIYWNGGNFATTNNYQIGRHWSGGDVTPFQGNIAQISIYNRALTAAEIQQNYNAKKGSFGL